MNMTKKSRFWWGVIILVVAADIPVSSASKMRESETEGRFPADVVGVHHLGQDYIINNFYINRHIRDSVGEGGGGGSRRCCVNLPSQSNPTLTADVRWEVSRIIRAPNQSVPEKPEAVGIYQAQVPVESYSEAGDLYVHFFHGGRVRIVVSRYTATGKLHPVQYGDTSAVQMATPGRSIKVIFSEEEVDTSSRKDGSGENLFGD